MLKERYYQKEAAAANIEIAAEHKSPLTIMATGTGKTIVMSKVIEWLYRNAIQVLVLAHRGLLLDQIRNTVTNFTGLIADREQAERFANWKSAVILATPNTLKGDRLSSKIASSQLAIVHDECHRSVTPTVRAVAEHFSPILENGYTATADRPDGKPLSSVYDKIAYQYSLAKGIKDGYLCPIVGRRVEDMEIDLGDLKAVGNDFKDEDLAEIIESHLYPIAHNIIRECEGRKKVLIFMPNVATSEHLARILCELGEEADYVSGKKGAGNGQVFAGFHSGKIRFLVSCQLVIEGYDEPEIDTVVMLRPTLSRIVYSQAVGRGTRLAPGKDHLLLLEFTFNSNRHKLVTPYELLGDAMSERVVDEATASRPSGDVDFLENLEYTQAHFYDVSEIIRRAMPRDYAFSAFDPLAIGDLVGVDLDSESEVWFEGRNLVGGITDAQRDILSRFDIDTDQLNKASASRLIGGLFEAKAVPSIGQASDAQLSYLSNLYKGQSFPPNIKKATASLLISKALEAKNGRIEHGI